MMVTIDYACAMNGSPKTWLLLVVSLPAEGATTRTRIWRALKALGCGALRDGAYLLPERADLNSPAKRPGRAVVPGS
jgi:DNA-binding transcriptional regulator PaaX